MPNSLAQLLTAWRARAGELREYGGDASARALEHCADDLEAALRAELGEALSLDAAARESGYSVDHLARLIREGAIPNAGRKHSPAIRRADLPHKAGALRTVAPGATSRSQIAQSVANSYQGERR
ncbi:MAG TPA: hypothetical protein VFW04_04125 [Gemmatimonadaceae bacterium]|nr:hypothetical protein [Gemmatimonadaceae bacterium]